MNRQFQLSNSSIAKGKFQKNYAMKTKLENILKINDMKKAGKILGIVLLVLIAAALTIAACHNIMHKRNIAGHSRGANMKQTEHYRNHIQQHTGRGGLQYMHPGISSGRQYGMNRQQRQGMNHQSQGMRPGNGRAMRPGMGSGMRRDSINNIRRGMNGGGMGQGMGQGMMRGIRQGAGSGMGNMPMQMNPPDNSQAGPASIFIDKIPNVTEKQKKEYADLLQKQKDEIVKLRTEMAAKMKSTLESQRSKMLNLFTSDQKKYIGIK
jgi:hypothetical protein